MTITIGSDECAAGKISPAHLEEALKALVRAAVTLNTSKAQR